MPIDPSIITNFSARFQPIQAPDPVESYKKLLGIAAMRDQAEMNQMEMRQRRQAMADDEAYRQMAMENGNVTPDMLLAKGLYKQAAAARQQELEAQTKVLGIREKLAGLDEKTRKAIKDQTEMLAEVGTSLTALPDDASKLKYWQEVAVPKLQAAKVQGIDPNTLPSQGLIDATMSEVNATKLALEQSKRKLEAGDIAREVIGQGDYVWGVNKAGKARQITDENGNPLRARPQASIVVNAQNKVANEQTLDDVARDILAYKKPPPWGTRGLPTKPSDLQLFAAMKRIEQETGQKYDANRWTSVDRTTKYFTGEGKGAVTMTNFKTLYGHADEVEAALSNAKLNDTRALNVVEQAFAQQFGKDAKFKSLKVAAQTFGEEYSKILGLGTGGEKEQIQKWFDSVDSPQSFRAAVKKTKAMAATKAFALADQYHRGTPGWDPVEENVIPEHMAREAANTEAAKNSKWLQKYSTRKSQQNDTKSPGPGYERMKRKSTGETGYYNRTTKEWVPDAK